MEITRRGFIGKGTLALAGLMVGFFNAGCIFSANVFENILTYISIGLQAFAAVVSLIPGIPQALAMIIAAVNAAFAAIQKAVNEYEAAPASQKASLLGAIVTAINAAVDQLAAFLAAIPALPAPLDAAIVALTKIIVSTLEGFLAKLPIGAAPAKTANLRGQAVAPVTRTLKQFKHDFNAELVTAGHPELQLK